MKKTQAQIRRINQIKERTNAVEVLTDREGSILMEEARTYSSWWILRSGKILNRFLNPVRINTLYR